MSTAYRDALNTARIELHRARQLLAEDLRAYPTPVSGCDLQYTQLLSEHRKVSAALAALGSDPFIPTPRTLAPNAGVESR